MYTLAQYVTCAGISVNAFFPDLVHLIVNLIKIGTPILLIILGMMDMLKAMMAQKEDEIKKAQGLFIKRLIAGVLVFLVFVIVELVFSVLGGVGATNEENNNMWNCVSCFINGSDDTNNCGQKTDTPITIN